jgi:hypothetical protein
MPARRHHPEDFRRFAVTSSHARVPCRAPRGQTIHFLESAIMIIKVLISCCALAVPYAAFAADPVQESMTVVRDPQTGKLRAPTAAEVRDLRTRSARPNGQPVQPPVPPKSSVRADGTRAIDLGDRALVYSVITRAADGKLVGHCVAGADAAARALENKQEADHER